MKPTETPKTDLVFLRSKSQKNNTNPLPFHIKIYPPIIDHELKIIKEEIKKCETDEEKQPLIEAEKELRKEISDAKTFNAHYKPFTLGEWAEYNHNKTSYEEILRRHILNTDGTHYFTEEDEFTPAAADYMSTLIERLKELSGVYPEDKKKVLEILEKALSVRREKQSKEQKNEKKEQNESAELTGPSSSGNVDSSLGKSQE